MKKWGKRLLVAVAALLLLVVGVAVALLVWIDSLAKVGVERGGTQALGVPSKVEGMNVGIFRGRVGMSGLNVGNPQGYDSPHFLNLKEGSVTVSLGSLRSQTVEIPKLELSDIDLYLEKKNNKANYQVILEHLQSLKTGAAAPASDDGQPAKRFIVRELVIRNVTAHVDLLPVGGKLSRMTVPVDEIRLTDVGSDANKGVVLAELSGVIVSSIFGAVLNKGKDILPPEIANTMTQGLQQAGQLGQRGLDVLGGAGKNVGGESRKILDGAGGLLKGLGKRGDKQEQEQRE